MAGVEGSGGTRWEACGLDYPVEGWKRSTQQEKAGIAAAQRADLG